MSDEATLPAEVQARLSPMLAAELQRINAEEPDQNLIDCTSSTRTPHRARGAARRRASHAAK